MRGHRRAAVALGVQWVEVSRGQAAAWVAPPSHRDGRRPPHAPSNPRDYQGLWATLLILAAEGLPFLPTQPYRPVVNVLPRNICEGRLRRAGAAAGNQRADRGLASTGYRRLRTYIRSAPPRERRWSWSGGVGPEPLPLPTRPDREPVEKLVTDRQHHHVPRRPDRHQHQQRSTSRLFKFGPRIQA